jgi:hypothetical protein
MNGREESRTEEGRRKRELHSSNLIKYYFIGTLTQNEMTVVKVYTTNLLAATHFSSGATELSDLAGNTIPPQTDSHLGISFFHLLIHINSLLSLLSLSLSLSLPSFPVLLFTHFNTYS